MDAGVVGVIVVTGVIHLGAQPVSMEVFKNSNHNIFNKKYKIETYHGKDPKN